VIAVSIALAIQALFFGDGGVLAFGANAFNMAFVGPMAGYAVYWTICHRESLTSARRTFAAGLGAYVGLNVAALCTAVEFGVQPTLFHSANGTPLYAPFHLSQTIPAMALAHLTVAGIVEFVLTAGVIAPRANLPVLHQPAAQAPRSGPARAAGAAGRRWASSGSAMILLTPRPDRVGTAFGEDASEQVVRTALSTGWVRLVPGRRSLSRGRCAAARDHRARYSCRGHAPAPCRRGRMTTRPRLLQWLDAARSRAVPCGCIGNAARAASPRRPRKRRACCGRRCSRRTARRRRAPATPTRVKLLSLFGLLVVAARSVGPGTAAHVRRDAGLAAAKLPLSFFVKRVWLFIPIFTGVVGPRR
jgi:hypothetical protein